MAARSAVVGGAGLGSALQRALEAQGDSVDELLRLEHQREAADQLAIGNVITSMRLLSSIDWPLFFERVSLVEQVLREDPAGAYAQMDFPTRDRYRHSVEQLAQARQAGRDRRGDGARWSWRARAARPTRPNDRRHHVGYYLISRGRFVLEQRPRVPADASASGSRGSSSGIRRSATWARSPSPIALGVASLLAYAARHGGTAGRALARRAASSLIPVSELAISLINAILTSQIPPRQLPKLAMRDGIPPTDRTLVVVPAIVDSEARLAALCRRSRGAVPRQPRSRTCTSRC